MRNKQKGDFSSMGSSAYSMVVSQYGIALENFKDHVLLHAG